MFYILFGPDTFTSYYALQDVKKKLGDPELLSISTSTFDGKDLALNQLQDACNVVPFMSPARLVIVDGLLGRFEPGDAKKNDTKKSVKKKNTALEEWKAGGDLIKSMPDTTVLVFRDGDVKDTKNPLFKALSPLAQVRRFPLMKGQDLTGWIQKRVAESGGKITPKAVSILAQLVGGDLWTMSSEIDKLLCYNSSGIISEDDINALTSYSRESNIFELVDAILEGKTKEAQQLLHRSFQEGAASPYLLAMITRQMRLIVMAREVGPRTPQAEVMSKLGTNSSYAIDKTLKQARAYSLDRIKDTYRKILEADIALKTGRYDGDMATELLVLELCRS